MLRHSVSARLEFVLRSLSIEPDSRLVDLKRAALKQKMKNYARTGSVAILVQVCNIWLNLVRLPSLSVSASSRLSCNGLGQME